MSRISGVGEKKLVEFADLFSEEIVSYLARESVRRDADHTTQDA